MESNNVLAIQDVIKWLKSRAQNVQMAGARKMFQTAAAALEEQEQDRWIPVTERLPSKEERREWIDKNLGGVGYLYPCLVTRYSSINPDRTKNNPYVAKHYYDGEDFVNNGEEVCSEYIVAWRPLPEPYTEEEA